MKIEMYPSAQARYSGLLCFSALIFFQKTGKSCAKGWPTMPLVFITGFGRGEPPEGWGEGEAFSRGGDFARPKAEDGGAVAPAKGSFPTL